METTSPFGSLCTFQKKPRHWVSLYLSVSYSLVHDAVRLVAFQSQKRQQQNKVLSSFSRQAVDSPTSFCHQESNDMKQNKPTLTTNVVRVVWLRRIATEQWDSFVQLWGLRYHLIMVTTKTMCARKNVYNSWHRHGYVQQ